MESLKSKMQQLKNEVDNLHIDLEDKNKGIFEVVSEREHSESELKSLRQQLKTSEAELERSESNYKSTMKRLNETKGSSDECDRLNHSLTENADVSNETLEELQNQLKLAKDAELEAEMRCLEVSKKLKNVEAQFEKVDKQATDYERKVSELQKEMNTVNHTLNTLESSGAKLETREEEFEIKIKDLQKTLEEVETKRNNSERSSQKLKRDIEIAKENLYSWKTKCGQVKHEMDSMLADANNM